MLFTLREYIWKTIRGKTCPEWILSFGGCLYMHLTGETRGHSSLPPPWHAAAEGIWALKQIIIHTYAYVFFSWFRILSLLQISRKSGQIFSKYFYCQTIYEYYKYFRNLGNSTQLRILPYILLRDNWVHKYKSKSN